MRLMPAACIAGALLSGLPAPARQPSGPPTAAHPAAPRYACPMKCEAEKTYDTPGKCPVCHMDLKALSSAPTLRVSGEGELKGGEPCTLTLSLFDSAGTPIKADLVDAVIVSRDGSSMVHERIRPGADGALRITRTLAPGEYLVFAGVPTAAAPALAASAPVLVSGKPPISKAMGVDAARPRQVEGMTATIDGWQDVHADHDSVLTLRITRDDRSAADLVKDGGLTRLIAISQDLKDCQVVQVEPKDPVVITAKFRPARQSLYRIWWETPGADRTLTFPFVIEAQ